MSTTKRRSRLNLVIWILTLIAYKILMSRIAYMHRLFVEWQEHPLNWHPASYKILVKSKEQPIDTILRNYPIHAIFGTFFGCLAVWSLYLYVFNDTGSSATSTTLLQPADKEASHTSNASKTRKQYDRILFPICLVASIFFAPNYIATLKSFDPLMHPFVIPEFFDFSILCGSLLYYAPMVIYIMTSQAVVSRQARFDDWIDRNMGMKEDIRRLD
ncbi:MAG: hypothetical protein Q9168_006104 [Polycauliona sp. 1 TL-2023]